MKTLMPNFIVICLFLCLSQIGAKSFKSNTANQIPSPGMRCRVNGDCWHKSLTVPGSYCDFNKCVIACGAFGNGYCNNKGWKGSYDCTWDERICKKIK